MLGFIKNNDEIIDANSKTRKLLHKKTSRWLVLVIVAGIGILAFGGLGEKKKEITQTADHITVDWSDDYIKEAEERLTNILSEIRGAGKVTVMLNFDYRREKILAKNTTGTLESQITDEGSESHSSQEELVLLYGSGGDEQPYVVKEGYPEPSGVLVVATGATDERVRLEMYEAVKALYGISGHRIKITAASGGS